MLTIIIFIGVALLSNGVLYKNGVQKALIIFHNLGYISVIITLYLLGNEFGKAEQIDFDASTFSYTGNTLINIMYLVSFILIASPLIPVLTQKLRRDN